MNLRTAKITVDINLVQPNRWNPNVQADFTYKKQKESIEKFGFIGSIIVRETAGIYEIINGEHRWKACKELGYTELPVETIGEISDEEAKILLFLLNMQGKHDLEKEVDIFKQLDEGQLQLLPYSKDEIENAKKLFEFDFSQYDKQEEVAERKPTNTICLALTEEEKNLWDNTLRVAKKEDKNDIQLFIGMINDYLELRIFRDDEGKWKF